MAYCRWSSMNWRCDIYCYQHVDGGYTTHVASNRVLGDIPAEPSWDLIQTNQEQWVIEHKAVMDFLKPASANGSVCCTMARRSTILISRRFGHGSWICGRQATSFPTTCCKRSTKK